MLQETIDVESNSFGALLDIIFMLVEEGEYEFINDVIPSLVALENSFDADYLMLLIDFKKRGVSISEAQESLNRIENHIQRNLFETIVKRMHFYDEL